MAVARLPSQWRQQKVVSLLLSALLIVSFYHWYRLGDTISFNNFAGKVLEGPEPYKNSNTNDGSPLPHLVVASMIRENTSWIQEQLPDWSSSIYTVDSPTAALSVPINKGRESMVYLSYIIDNYATLPAFVVFLHSSRYQWHNDDPLYDSVNILRRIKLSHVASSGYVNLRCVWTLGCPSEIFPSLHHSAGERATGAEHSAAQTAFAMAFTELFPGRPLPGVVGASCCAQFAVSREKIRERPREDYVRMRQWLVDTMLDDATSGRVFEYSWHMLFGMEAVHCPDAESCYCRLYGLCGLKCRRGSCEGRYRLPKTSRTPEGWPDAKWL